MNVAYGLYEKIKEKAPAFVEKDKVSAQWNKEFYHACTTFASLELENIYADNAEANDLYYDFMYFYHKAIDMKKECAFKKRMMAIAKELVEKYPENPFAEEEEEEEGIPESWDLFGGDKE